MDVEVRLAKATDRTALDQFYAREGIDFQAMSRAPYVPIGPSQESMFIVALDNEMVVASLKLDVVKTPKHGKVGYIQHFEIEDELEATDLGKKMLEKTTEIAQAKNLSALETHIKDGRTDMLNLFTSDAYEEEHRDIHLRRTFKVGFWEE